MPDDDRALIDAYTAVGRTLDDLPYTDDFTRLLQLAARPEPEQHARPVFRRLQNLRKANKLPTLGRAPSTPIRVTPDEEAALTRLVVDLVGSLGQRDQLLYDPRFPELVAAFNTATGRNLDLHDAWRLLAKIAK